MGQQSFIFKMQFFQSFPAFYDSEEAITLENTYIGYIGVLLVLSKQDIKLLFSFTQYLLAVSFYPWTGEKAWKQHVT